MANLITVPTFTFNQGDIFNQEMSAERPISIDYYDGTITLRQDGDYDQQEEILISVDYIEKLFKEIKKHLPEAVKRWNKPAKINS